MTIADLFSMQRDHNCSGRYDNEWMKLSNDDWISRLSQLSIFKWRLQRYQTPFICNGEVFFFVFLCGEILILKTYFSIIKIINFRGDLTDVSAIKEALICRLHIRHLVDVPFVSENLLRQFHIRRFSHAAFIYIGHTIDVAFISETVSVLVRHFVHEAWASVLLF